LIGVPQVLVMSQAAVTRSPMEHWIDQSEGRIRMILLNIPF